MKHLCPLNHKICHQVLHGGERCSDAPTLELASECIKSLLDIKNDLENEIEALDELLDFRRGGNKES